MAVRLAALMGLCLGVDALGLMLREQTWVCFSDMFDDKDHVQFVYQIDGLNSGHNEV